MAAGRHGTMGLPRRRQCASSCPERGCATVDHAQNANAERLDVTPWAPSQRREATAASRRVEARRTWWSRNRARTAFEAASTASTPVVRLRGALPRGTSRTSRAVSTRCKSRPQLQAKRMVTRRTTTRRQRRRRAKAQPAVDRRQWPGAVLAAVTALPPSQAHRLRVPAGPGRRPRRLSHRLASVCTMRWSRCLPQSTRLMSSRSR